jgi:hypothetical protein
MRLQMIVARYEELYRANQVVATIEARPQENGGQQLPFHFRQTTRLHRLARAPTSNDRP